MVLRRLQSLLGRLYDVTLDYDVYDFLVTDRRALAGVTPDNDQRAPEEELLLAETADGAGVALYIDPRVLERLERADPLGALTEGNLADYCTALEGVSHFTCVAWCAARGRPVSLLGLEMQADVDKYVAAVLLAGSQRGGQLVRGLHARLFEHVRYCDGLDATLRALYARANAYAARFCRRLEERFLRRREARVTEMLEELRRFYRLGDAGKLACIEAV